jgi:hypothetical protein
MNLNYDVLNSFVKFREDKSRKIYKIVKGREAFDLARNMLNCDEEKLWNDNWASKWSEEEKDGSLFVLFKKKYRVREKVGIALFVGIGGNFSKIGELHQEKKAFRIWKEFMDQLLS